ncbi:MAG: thioesterase family protein [Planctomycetota bacterium]
MAPSEHSTRLRVRYGEVDRMGVAYHAHYLVWFEQGRTEYLRSLGSTYRALEEAGTLLMVTETGVRHLKSARYDDEVEVRTRLDSVKGVRLRFVYEVHRDGDLLATGFTVLAAADTRGRPRRLPPELAEILTAHAPAGSDASPASNPASARERS